MARIPPIVPVSYLNKFQNEGQEMGPMRNFVPKKYTAKRDEHADDDGRDSRTFDMVGFLEHETHDGGVVKE
jgi:hypothetical protein